MSNDELENRTANFVQEFLNRWGHYMLGFMVPLAALVMAYLQPARAKDLVGSAGLFAFLAWLWSGENRRCGKRMMGLLVALVPLLASFAIPGEAQTLQSAAGFMAGIALLWTA